MYVSDNFLGMYAVDFIDDLMSNVFLHVIVSIVYFCFPDEV